MNGYLKPDLEYLIEQSYSWEPFIISENSNGESINTSDNFTSNQTQSNMNIINANQTTSSLPTAVLNNLTTSNATICNSSSINVKEAINTFNFLSNQNNNTTIVNQANSINTRTSFTNSTSNNNLFVKSLNPNLNTSLNELNTGENQATSNISNGNNNNNSNSNDPNNDVNNVGNTISTSVTSLNTSQQSQQSQQQQQQSQLLAQQQPIRYSYGYTNQTQIANANMINQQTNLTLGYNASNFDPWSTCLSVFLSYNHVYTKCVQARIEAWPFIYTRLTQLFPYVDPNDSNEKSSSFFGSSLDKLRKQAFERLVNLNLWKNYLICSFCLTPGSGKNYPVSNNNNESLLSTNNISNFSNTIENSKFYTTCGTATSLLKIIVPFIKYELNDFREITIRGLGNVNADAFRDLFEELIPYIKEAIFVDNKRQEKVRRVKKRDYIRLTLIRIFELLAESGTLAKIMVDRADEIVRRTFLEYIDGVVNYFEQETEKNSDIMLQIRLHFCKFISKLIESIQIATTQQQQSSHQAQQQPQSSKLTSNFSLFSLNTRYNLFDLFDKWSSKYSIRNSGVISQPPAANNKIMPSENSLDISALKACSLLICCGETFDQNCITADSNSIVFEWLNHLLRQEEIKHSKYLYDMTLNTIIKLLENNSNNSTLLEWLIQKCYSSAYTEICDLCFIAITKVYIDNKCIDFYIGSMLTLALINIGNTRINIHETAIRLLKVINQRHLQESTTITDGNNDIINSLVLYSKSQLYISEYIARKNPEQTMQIFSEVTSKLELATYSIRQTMLIVLVPWIYNLELVDPNIDKISLEPNGNNNGLAFLNGDGYGCVSATEMILVNLFYLTVKYSDEHTRDLELIWAILASTWQSNLKIIIRFLYIIISLAPFEMIPHAKKVIVYLSKSKPEALILELMNEIDSVVSFNNLIEKTEAPPFYRYKINNNSSISTSVIMTTSNPVPTIATTTAPLNNSVNLNASVANDDNETSTSSSSSINSNSNSNTGSNTSADETKLNASNPANILRTSNISLNVNNNDDNSTATKRTTTITNTKQSHVESSILPMPIFGGYFCPLNTIMYTNHQQSQQQNVMLLGCNITIVLLTELMFDGANYNWSQYYPQLLHYCILHFDNTKRLVCENAKKLFLNILYVICVQNELNSLSELLLDNIEYIIDNQSIIYNRKLYDYSRMSNNNNNNNILINNICRVADTSSSSVQPDAKDYLSSMLKFMAMNKNMPLWSFESVDYGFNSKTSPNISNKVENLSLINEFINNLKNFLFLCVPHLSLDTKLATYSLNTGLHSSSKHFACRSLQINRFLQIEINSFSCLVSMITRLMEIVSESNDEVQSYIIELLLTLIINAELIAKEYSVLLSVTSNSNKNVAVTNNGGSLPTGIISYANRDLIKAKSAALSRTFPHYNLVTSSSSFHNKLVNSYEQSLALSLFDRRWVLMQRKTGTNESLSSETRDQQQCLVKSKTDSLDSKKIQTSISSNLSTTPSTNSNSGLNLNDLDENFANKLSKSSQNLSVSQKSRPQNFGTSMSQQQQQQQQTKYTPSSSINLVNNNKSILEPEKNEKERIIMNLFYVGICLLDSDYEYEFLLGVELLDKLLTTVDLLDVPEFREKVEKFYLKINWHSFPGLQNLLIRGCTSADTIESTYKLLIKLIKYTNLPFIDMNGNQYHGLWGLSINLISFLPYMLFNNDKPNEICLKAAECYAKYIQTQIDCNEHIKKNENLQNLVHVLNSYINGKFVKDRIQWSKCVITYLSEYFTQFRQLKDTNLNFHLKWIIFLTELLEKNSLNQQYQACVMICLNSLLNSINFNDSSNWSYVNNEFLRVFVKYLDGENKLWKEAMDLIKIAVNKSSSLSLSNTNSNEASMNLNEQQQQSIIYSKKELPGRTLEFDFDFSPFSISNSRHSSPTSSNKKQVVSIYNTVKQQQQQYEYNETEFFTLSTLNKTSTLNDGEKQKMMNANWQKTYQSQSKTREKLVSILNVSGQQHIGLPKSPSVIFSQNDVVNGTNNFYFQEQEQKEQDLDQKQQQAQEQNGGFYGSRRSIDGSLHKIGSMGIFDIQLNDKGKSSIKNSTTSLHMRASSSNILGLMDDNNFINHTFSFLDDVCDLPFTIQQQQQLPVSTATLSKTPTSSSTNLPNEWTTIYGHHKSQESMFKSSSINNSLTTISPKSTTDTTSTIVDNSSRGAGGDIDGTASIKTTGSMTSGIGSLSNKTSKSILTMTKKSSKTMTTSAAAAIKQQMSAMRRSESFQSFSGCTTEESVADFGINDETSCCATSGDDDDNLLDSSVDSRKPQVSTVQIKKTPVSGGKSKLTSLSCLISNFSLQNKSSSNLMNSENKLFNRRSLSSNRSLTKLTDVTSNDSSSSAIMVGKNMTSNTNIGAPVLLNTKLSFDEKQQPNNDFEPISGGSNNSITYQHDFLLPLSNLINTNNEEIEDIWKNHISILSTNDENSNVIETFYLFKRLFKETRRRLNILLPECCHYLSRSTKIFQDIEKRILKIVELINTKIDCPIVFFDSEILQSSNIFEKHRRIAWEIGENYDTYVYVKRATVEVSLSEINIYLFLIFLYQSFLKVS